MILGMSDAFKGCRFLTWGSEPCFHHGIVILPGNFEVMPRRMSREWSLGGMGGGGGVEGRCWYGGQYERW